MKKIINLVLISLIILLSGCKKEQAKVLVPSGTPRIAQIYLEKEYDTSVVNGADALVAAFTSGEYEFIYAPINLGVKMYKSNQKYRLLGSVVSGNYYLVSKGEFTLEDLKNKEICLFSKNQMPSIIANYVFEHNDLKNLNISYVASVTEAQNELILNNDLVVLTSEPSLSVLLDKIDGLTYLDLQASFKEITGYESYPQAALFVRNDVSKKKIDQYVKDLTVSIEKVMGKKVETADLQEEMNYGYDKLVFINSLDRSNISFIPVNKNKQSFESLINILFEYNAQLVGEIPNEEFYYQD